MLIKAYLQVRETLFLVLVESSNDLCRHSHNKERDEMNFERRHMNETLVG